MNLISGIMTLRLRRERGGANQNASEDHSDPGWHLSNISNQPRLKRDLFVEGRSDSGRLAGSVLKWASWLVGGWVVR